MNENHNTGRDFAVLVAGVAAGILGSRLLPPLIANASGAGRARRGHDPFEMLVEDHRQILSLTEQMTTAPTDSTARRGSLFLMLKRKIAKHALAEEDVVYPVLHTQGNDVEASKGLYDEHADIKILLFQIEDALMNGRDWSQPLNSLRDLLQHHIDDEETNVFPRLRQMLNESEAPKISGQISREEALVL